MHEALLTPTPAPISLRRKAGERRPREPQKGRPPVDERVLPRRLGRYQLFAHIGRGGMADIFLAQADAGLGGSRLVVIKEVLPTLAHSAEFAEMLVSEAKLAARLSHANVVKVEDLGRAADVLYIAMEYVEGIDLRELLRRCAKSKIALPVEFSLRIVIEALRGLSHAHRARDDEGKKLGIVHRDVSPSNVLLSFEGEIKLCDFGIARANTVAEELPEDAILGKAGYMSPEQAWGEPLDARADVFAAGIILWELLAGRRLYKAGEGERLIDVARVAAIPGLPARELPREEELYGIVARALGEDRAERYATAADMLQDLEDYTAGARMVASQIRFGEWLMEHFGQEVVLDRRGRERVMRALARGPAAVIQPLAPSRLPDYDATPSAFPVALRADPEAPIDAALRSVTPSPTAAVSARAKRKPKVVASASSLAVTPRTPAVKMRAPAAKAEARVSFDPRLLVYAMVLVAAAYATLRLLLG